MKTETVTYWYYEPGDKLKNVATGKIYTFVEYGFCDTACIKNKEGMHTWGRKFIHDPECFQYIKPKKKRVKK